MTDIGTDTELATIPEQDVYTVFTEQNALNPYLKRIRTEIDKFEPDVGTAGGRKEIASFAYRIARTKTSLDAVGKRLADDVKAVPKKVDAGRKLLRDTLEGWQEEVRRPLTEWETAEEKRIAAHVETIEWMNELSAPNAELGAAELRESLKRIEAVVVGPQCEEFEGEYAMAQNRAKTTLTEHIARQEKQEAEQAELERLRKAEAERAELERVEAIKRQAAEQAKAEAEATAKAEAERVEAAAKAERDAAERRELELKLAAEAADRRALEADARAKQEAEAKLAREAEEAAHREADKKHRGAINRAAAEAFQAGGISEETAKAVVSLIAQKAIPGVTIHY